MRNIDLDRLLNEPIHAMDFQFMIGDVHDLLHFSEMNIEWQYRRELQSIERRGEIEDIPQDYKEHLEENAQHRFTVSLPLRIRYAALVALTTSVEWSVGLLVKALRQPLPRPPKGPRKNETVRRLTELVARTGVGKSNFVQDFDALTEVRNCIAHSAGIEAHYRHRDKLTTAIGRLDGFSLENRHFLGQHVWVEKGALDRYIGNMRELIVTLARSAHEQGLLRTTSP